MKGNRHVIAICVGVLVGILWDGPLLVGLLLGAVAAVLLIAVIDAVSR